MNQISEEVSSLTSSQGQVVYIGMEQLTGDRISSEFQSQDQIEQQVKLDERRNRKKPYQSRDYFSKQSDDSNKTQSQQDVDEVNWKNVKKKNKKKKEEKIDENEATVEQLKELSKVICPCYAYGEPRGGTEDECFELTEACDTADADLTGIPKLLCECKSTADPRAGGICPAYCTSTIHPADCICDIGVVGTE
ncbi:MAG: hypothetical protein EZS28_032464 [Streblomastix strix]|uniref:Uncharacterized protein n=1 Tax=Streblomastix strix TaxID=222440 RepID=A0A5J4UPR9_9EUKA|nr:MAG: hypothetical protein EZS28_032464 [Streblomastix strix]